MKRKTLITLITSLMTLSTVSCATDKYSPINDGYEGPTGNFKVQRIGEVSIHTELQNKYLSNSYLDVANYANGSEELSRPEPVKFRWEYKKKTGESNPLSYTLTLSKDQELKTDVQTFEAKDNSLDVYNLYINQNYYYTISANYANSSYRSKDIYRFKVKDQCPRNLYIDGISNARDIGGHKTEDGGYIRQGLLYRTARLNESGTVIPEITSSGITTMREELGIKSELDLRGGYSGENGNLKESILGGDINYYYLPMVYGPENGVSLLESNLDYIRKAFSVLSKKENYPAFYHCSIGTDRTGLLTILLGGLLGVSKDDLYQDYLFSNFGKIGTNRTLDHGSDSVLKYISAIERMPGKTFSAQVTNYLYAIGVGYNDISNIISILKVGGDEERTDYSQRTISSHSFYPSESVGESQSCRVNETDHNYYTLRDTTYTLSFNIKSSKAVTTNLYGMIASGSTSCPMNQALSIKVNGEEITLPNDQLGQLGARLTLSPWNLMPLGVAPIKTGNNTIEIIGPSRSGTFINIENITLSPQGSTYLELGASWSPDNK